MKVRNPFTGELAEVYKYKLRYRDGREQILYGFLYFKKFIKVTYAMNIITVDCVIDDYLEAIYLGKSI